MSSFTPSRESIQSKADKDEIKRKRAALEFVEKRLNFEAELKFKIVLLGCSGVGKSSLLAKFLDELANVERLQATVMCDFFHCILKLGGRTVQLRVWDIGGLERFEAANATSKFYRDAQGVLIVFSIADIEAFNSLPRWIERARQFVGPGRQFDSCLVGNKSDLPANQRLISSREAQRFANLLGLPYIETSAVTVTNVQKAFVDLTLAMMRRFEAGRRDVDATDDCHDDASPTNKGKSRADTRLAKGSRRKNNRNGCVCS